MASRWGYLRQFLRQPGTIGAITPSSAALARAMADQIDLRRARVVVEYGPGTGVFTRELLRRLGPDGRLVAIELHPGFFAKLRERIGDPRLTLVHGSAADVGAHLAVLGLERADAVLSALPFANMPADVRDAILGATQQVLAPGGRFVAVQYLPFALLPLLRRRFRDARVARWCPWNLPPAFVMVATDAAAHREPSALAEAQGMLTLAAGAALTLGVYRRRWGALAALAIPALLALYRDPPRRPPLLAPPGAVLAPGEGRVVRVGPGTDSGGAACLEIRIFLALWDVHVQRAPLDATVVSVEVAAGGFGPAFRAEAGDHNQRTTLVLQGDSYRCEVVQVAGILARRIVTWVRPGEHVEAGQRLGMIKFGSQVILRLPPLAEPLVCEGDHVRVGEDVVALVGSGPVARHPEPRA